MLQFSFKKIGKNFFILSIQEKRSLLAFQEVLNPIENTESKK